MHRRHSSASASTIPKKMCATSRAATFVIAPSSRSAARRGTSTAMNVVAMLPGSDPQFRDEWLVMTAHYDHLGTAIGADGKPVIYNGADDNASGTAAVLEVAHRLANGARPKRSVLVALMSGE